MIDSEELHRDDDGQWRYIPPNESEEAQDLFLPKSVLDAFTRRIEKLSESSREALALAALIEPGAEFDFGVWIVLLGNEVKVAQAEEIRTEAMKNRLLRQIDDNRYAFRPPDLAKVLIQTLSQSRQRDLRRQLAEILRRRQADPTLVAYHYEQAGLATEAALYLETVGAQARADNAIPAAIAYYNRVITLIESRSAYKALGNLYRQQGQWADSLSAFQQALTLTEQAGDVVDQAQILNGLSFTLWLYDDYREAYQPAAEVLTLAGVPETEQAVAQSHLGVIAWLVGRLSEAETWAQKAVDTLLKAQAEDGLAEANLAEAYNRLGLIQFSQGNLEAAQTAFQRCLDLNQKLNDYRGQGYGLNGLSQVAISRGDFDQAFAHLETARQLFQKAAGQDGLIITYKNYGRTLLAQNQPDEALPWLTKALQLALRLGKHRAYGLSDIYLLIAQATLQRGQLDVARSAADDALKLVEARRKSRVCGSRSGHTSRNQCDPRRCRYRRNVV